LNFGIINKTNAKILSHFKNVDLFFINISKISFSKIAFNLNSKFYKKNLNFNENKLFDLKVKEKKIINFCIIGSFNLYRKNQLINDVIKLISKKIFEY
jgi:hypothetical protein